MYVFLVLGGFWIIENLVESVIFKVLSWELLRGRVLIGG